MSVHPPISVPILVGLVWAAGIPSGAQRAPHPQPQRGSLQRLGGPTSLLRQPLSGMRDLRALADTVRLRLQPAFQGEEIRLGPPHRWLDQSWDLQLAAVRDTVYKISAEIVLTDKTNADNLSTAVYDLLQKEFGEPRQLECSDYSWTAEDGTAVLRLSEDVGQKRVTLLLTSSVARSFTPR